MFKKIVMFILVFIFTFSTIFSKEKIVLAYVDFYPYEYNENNVPKGILVDIVKEAFKRADIELELEFYPFNRAYVYAKEGKIDGLFNFYKNETRMNFFDYSEMVIQNEIVLFVPKNSQIDFQSLSDLKGKKIGVLSGYSYGTQFDNDSSLIKEPGNSHDANIKKLGFDRIDVYPCDKLVGHYSAKKIGLIEKFSYLPKPLKIMDGYIGFTKGKHLEIIEEINKVIIDMRKSGEIDEISNDYMK